MTMNMHRRQWLQMLGLACGPRVPIHLARQIHEDLLAVTEPDALPAMDWGDLNRMLEDWGGVALALLGYGPPWQSGHHAGGLPPCGGAASACPWRHPSHCHGGGA